LHGQKFTSGVSYPGGREAVYAWIDPSTGSIWLFGGKNGVGQWSDLFRFDIASAKWSWLAGSNVSGANGYWGLKGSASNLNSPSARQSGATIFINATKELVLFGGKSGTNATNQVFWNDMWSYNLTTNLWTWVHGSPFSTDSGSYPANRNVSDPSALPPSRGAMATCSMGNSMYFFGGQVGLYPYITYNDLCRLDVVQETSLPVTPPSQPPSQPCPGVQPSPDFYCNITSGTWVLHSTTGGTVVTPTLNVTSPIVIPGGVRLVVNGSATLQCSGAIDIQGQLVVQGNASFCGSLTVSTFASINVSSCANFDGAKIIISADSISEKLKSSTNGSFSFEVAQFACRVGNSGPSPVSLVGLDASGCLEITATTQYTDRSLSVIFQSQEKSSCKAPAQDDGISVVGLAVGLSLAGLVIIIIAIVTLVPPIRRKVFPFSASTSSTNRNSTIE
jgi:hypothetical protein